MFESYRPITIAICGGGLAGLTLARQLRQGDPQSRIVVIDREPDPLPIAAHKVGESSVELGAHYFGNHLRLEEYLQEAQLPKFGLRYFLGPATSDLSTRLEFGPQSFPPVPSLQLDRGRLENDLRAFNRADGVEVCTDVSIQDIELGAGDNQHVVSTDDPDLGSIRADWVIDATGRRRLLQNRLGLSKPCGHEASAAWWRVPGIRKVNDMLGAIGRKPWKSRLQDKRWLSTNHIMGRGYWVWFIPLSSGNTSIGIVTDESIHPLRTYNTHEKAMAWLRTYEPAVAAFIERDTLLDFKILKRYSYWSKQVLSVGRWACVGEAGVFSDPFYSPGSDSIAWANTFTSKMISKWRQGELAPSYVDQLNRTFLDDIGEITNSYYRGMYGVFGSPRVMVVKVIWDTCLYWAFPCQLFFQRHLEEDALAEYARIASRLRPLNQRIQDLFRAWADCPGMGEIKGGRFVAYSSMPLFRQLQMDLTRKKSQDEMFSEMWTYLANLEEWAQVLFHSAMKDAGVEASFRGGPESWVNPLGIGLDPTKWQEDGLFEISGEIRSLTEMAEQTKNHIFRPIES